MNRSILIVICDFLLLSLLTFSTDINHMADENTRPPSKVAVATNNPAGPGADLAAMMQRALQDEQQAREQMQRRQEQLEQQLREQTGQTEQARNEAARRQAESAASQRENQRLQQQIAAGETNLENLNRQLQAMLGQAQESRQQLALKETQSQREADLAAALQRQLDLLSKSNQLAQTEQQRLASQLQLADAQKTAAVERAALMQQEVQAAQAENARLAEGFKVLATNSSELTREINEDRELTPNTIFSEFESNRLGACIVATRTGVFGQSVIRNKNTETIVVSDGSHYFALCHVQDTPLTLWDPGTDWNQFSGSLTGRASQVPIHSVTFDEADPRVIMIPLTPAEARQLGCQIYRLSSEPYKFQDAILVGAADGYYGECNFQLDPAEPKYVRLDRGFLRGLVGKFNPSRGDLVFSRRGELLGIMVNDTYCLTIRNYDPGPVLAFNTDLSNQHTGGILAGLWDNLYELPQKLQ